MTTGHRVLLIFVAVTCFANLRAASAQSSSSRFEVGGQISTLRLSDFATTSVGFGGHLTYEVSPWADVEGEFNFFPHDDVTVNGSTITPRDFGIAYRRRRSEAFFGSKVGIHSERIGIFAKVRPGFTRLSHRDVACHGDACPLMSLLLAQPVYQTEFALDVGGVLEFYPSSRAVARLDLGDTLVRHRSSAPPCWGARCTSHNFTSRFGLGVRF